MPKYGVVGADGKRKPGRSSDATKAARETLKRLCEELPDDAAGLIERNKLLEALGYEIVEENQRQKRREKIMALLRDADGQGSAELLRLMTDEQRWKRELTRAGIDVSSRLQALGYRESREPRWEREETE